MDELLMAGKLYISSKRASEMSGYAKDYIGQLVRGGKLEAVRVGRAWFVLETSLKSHMGASVADTVLSENASPALPRRDVISKLYHPGTILNTWEQIKYHQDDSPIIPTVAIKSVSEGSLNVNQNIVISDKPILSTQVPRASLANVDGISFSVKSNITKTLPTTVPKAKITYSQGTRSNIPVVYSRMLPVVATVGLLAITYVVLSSEFGLSNSFTVGEPENLNSLSAVGSASFDPISTAQTSFDAGFRALTWFRDVLIDTSGEYISMSLDFIGHIFSRIAEK